MGVRAAIVMEYFSNLERFKDDGDADEIACVSCKWRKMNELQQMSQSQKAHF